MKFQVFAIYDEKAEAFMTPFYAPAIGMAVRNFQDQVNQAGSIIATHPSDFSIYHLGTFDNTSLERENYTPPKLLGHATDYLTQTDWVPNEIDTDTPLQRNTNGADITE